MDRKKFVRLENAAWGAWKIRNEKRTEIPEVPVPSERAEPGNAAWAAFEARLERRQKRLCAFEEAQATFEEASGAYNDYRMEVGMTRFKWPE